MYYFILVKMILEKDNYYHLYNRSINEEKLFYNRENYLYFLKKYIKFANSVSTLAYCLMPTHFHFLIKVTTHDSHKLNRAIGDLLSGYAKAINKQQNRHGSLFEQHTKAKPIKSQNHLIALVHYIHQNPIRSKLVQQLEDWEFSSYRDYVGFRTGKLPVKEEILSQYKNIAEFIEHSNMINDWDIKI